MAVTGQPVAHVPLIPGSSWVLLRHRVVLRRGVVVTRERRHAAVQPPRVHAVPDVASGSGRPGRRQASAADPACTVAAAVFPTATPWPTCSRTGGRACGNGGAAVLSRSLRLTAAIC